MRIKPSSTYFMVICRTLCGALCILWALPALCRGYDLYVSSINANIYLMPDTASRKLFTLSRGDAVTGVKKAGYWHAVSYKGRTGWVYKFQVRETPPVKKQSVYSRFRSLFKKYDIFKSRSRRRASAYSSVAAARGLRAYRKRATGHYKLDYDALEKIESVHVTDEQALAFLREGGVDAAQE